MKSRMMVSLLVIALAAAVIGGATMAWFTDSDPVEPVTFTAGTVDIKVTDQEGGYENVNPGDCHDVTATITNVGSKNVVLKLDDITASFNVANDAPADIALDYSLITIHFQNANPDDWTKSLDGNWVIVFEGEAAEVHDLSNYVIYYVGGPIGPEASVTLALKVCFDGPGMDDDYQGATLELNGTFYAIQASNFAPYHEWGTDLYGTPAN